jgi:hypothetical protein
LACHLGVLIISKDHIADAAGDQRKPRRRRFIASRILPAGLAVALLAVGPVAAAGAPQLTTDTTLATAGYYRLSWTADTPQVTLEERSPETGAVRTLYTGPDRATLISGQSDGIRVYRAGEIGPDGNVSAWSEPVTVTVTHHPINRALAFFAVGAVVFLATLALIVHGARRHA